MGGHTCQTDQKEMKGKRIRQIRVSESIKGFKAGLMDLYNLKEYNDINAPAFFFGMYRKEDIKAINNHKGFKIVAFGGVDTKNISEVKCGNILIDMFKYQQLLSKEVKVKKFIRVKAKDYSDLKQEPKGDKIYCYINKLKSAHHYHDGLIEELRSIYGKDIILGRQGHTMQQTINKYYKQSFVNLQFNPVAGGGTQIDMAYMGRPSISNFPAPWCYHYNSFDDIIEGIEKARALTYYEQEEIIKAVDSYYDDSGDWLNLNFWK